MVDASTLTQLAVAGGFALLLLFFMFLLVRGGSRIPDPKPEQNKKETTSTEATELDEITGPADAVSPRGRLFLKVTTKSGVLEHYYDAKDIRPRDNAYSVFHHFFNWWHNRSSPSYTFVSRSFNAEGLETKHLTILKRSSIRRIDVEDSRWYPDVARP